MEIFQSRLKWFLPLRSKLEHNYKTERRGAVIFTSEIAEPSTRCGTISDHVEILNKKMLHLTALWGLFYFLQILVDAVVILLQVRTFPVQLYIFSYFLAIFNGAFFIQHELIPYFIQNFYIFRRFSLGDLFEYIAFQLMKASDTIFAAFQQHSVK